MGSETKHPLTALTDYRRQNDRMTLDDLVVALLDKREFKTTKATLSRIENGEHPVSIELLPHLMAVTGLSAQVLRPDIAEHFATGEAAA